MTGEIIRVESSPCPKCGFLAASDDKFCERCGQDLLTKNLPQINSKVTKYCPSCGISVNSNDVYCELCGSVIDEPQPKPESFISQSTSAIIPNNKSIGIAAFLALWFGIFGFWGVGHFYAGKTIRGIIILAISLMIMLTVAAIFTFAGFASPILGFLSDFVPSLSSGQIDNSFDTFVSSLGIILIIVVIYFILWGIAYVWQCIDACRAVQKWNNILAETGRKPW